MNEDEEPFRNGEPHIYGTYYDQFPIRDIENVDARRDSIGLPPLWYINKIYGIELPPDYKTTGNELKNNFLSSLGFMK